MASSAYVIRSGNIGENNSIPAPPKDRFQLVTESVAQQVNRFLETTPSPSSYQPQELERLVVADLLDKHLAVGKDIDGSVKTFAQASVARIASREKLQTYLQADNLQGAFTLLNGTHPPLETEFKGKYNPLRWMQMYVQAQPPYENLPPELQRFEAFEHHVKDLRRQVGLCLGSVEPPTQGGKLVLKTPEAIDSSTKAAAEQLQAIKQKISALEKTPPEALLDKAITHHIKSSVDSAKMLEIAWFQQLLDSVENRKTAEGQSLLENPQVRHHLLGLVLLVNGGKSGTEQPLLTSAFAELAPATPTVEGILAPVPQRIVDGVASLGKKAQALTQVNMGLPAELLNFLPKEFQSVEAFINARSAFKDGLGTVTPEILAFAKSQLVSPEAQEGLIQAYRIWLGQQAVQQTNQLEALLNPKPPVPRFAKQRASIAEIPKDMRAGVQHFITAEQQRLAEMRVTEAAVQKKLTGAAKQTFEMIGKEVFSLPFAEQQLAAFTTELNTAVKEEVIKPVTETIDTATLAVKTKAEETKAKITEVINKAIVEPIKEKANQVADAFDGVKTRVGKGVKALVNTVITGGGPPPVDEGIVPPIPSSDGIAFVNPLKLVEEQGEKIGWWPALLEHSKGWLPIAVVGTIGLGVLAWTGSKTVTAKQGKPTQDKEGS